MKQQHRVQILEKINTKDDLYNLIKRNKFNSNDVIKDLHYFIEQIDTISGIYEKSANKDLFLDLTSKYLGKSQMYIRLVLDFLKKYGFISLGNKIEATYKGNLIETMDPYMLTADLIRFMLFDIDWQRYFNKEDIYLSKDSRQYVFIMLYQFNLTILEELDKIKVNPLYKMSYFSSVENIFASSSLGLVYDEILIKLGLGIKEKGYFIPNDICKEIFKYYSIDLYEQYIGLIEECWDYFDRGDFEQAFDIAKSIAKVLVFVPEAYNVLGCVYIKIGEMEKARDMLSYAIEIYENTSFGDKESDSYILLHYNLGLAYLYMNENFKALKIFNDIKRSKYYDLGNIDELIIDTKKLLIIK